MQWQAPTFPAPPREAPTVEVVEQAYLSGMAYGPLRTMQRPRRWFRGAVHDRDGRLVRTSQKIGGTNGHPWVPADPARVRVREDVERLEGTWLYGGHWMQHFGHFFTETITTLWPDVGKVEGIVLHRYLRRAWSVEPWQQRLLDLAGHGGLPVRVVARRPLQVERLVVPSRTVVAGGWAHPEAREVWERVAEPFRGTAGPERLYLSRTVFHDRLREEGRSRGPRTSREQDVALDRLFAEHGFEVVSPELLPLDEQLRLVANAGVLAGGSGSALHLSAFAGRGTRVLELGDTRGLDRPVDLQRIIDTVSGHRTSFVRGDATVPQVAAHLRSLGLAGASPRRSPWRLLARRRLAT